jgi:hypothetical protein
MAFMLDCDIEEYSSPNDLSIFQCSHIYIETKRIFSVTVDTDREIAFSCALNVLAITKDLIYAYGEKFARVVHRQEKLSILEQVILFVILILKNNRWGLFLVNHLVVNARHFG